MTIRSTIAAILLLPAAAPAAAAVLTVGPGGTHATVQAAVDAAVATPVDDELRLRATTFFEQVDVSAVSDLGGRLELSGGWDAAYAVRDPTPGATALDGGGTGRVFFAPFLDAGQLVLRGLAFRNGVAGAGLAYGGGLDLGVGASVQVTIEDCLFDSNLATTDTGAFGSAGGGAAISTNGSAEVHLAGVAFTGNQVFIDDTIGAPRGGGIHLYAGGSSRIVLRHGVASGNVVLGGTQRKGAGISASADEDATIAIEDFRVTDNHCDLVDVVEVRGHGIEGGANGNGVLELRRLEVTENWSGTGDGWPQVLFNLFGGTVHFTDSVVARAGMGLEVGSNAATLYLTNLTVTDHEAIGANVSVGAPGSARVVNTIAWDNAGGNLVLTGGAATGADNLVGIDPGFVDAPGGDYRLSSGSVAENAGNAAPDGGLGRFDLAHAPRSVGAGVDQGALERQAIFADDFEREDIRAWSTTAP